MALITVDIRKTSLPGDSLYNVYCSAIYIVNAAVILKS